MNTKTIKVFDIQTQTATYIQYLIQNQSDDPDLLLLIARVLDHTEDLQAFGTSCTERVFKEKIIDCAKADIASGTYHPPNMMIADIYDDESIAELKKLED